MYDEQLLKRLDEELKLRGYSSKTRIAYRWHTVKFMVFCQKKSIPYSKESVRSFLLYMIDKGYVEATVRMVLGCLTTFFTLCLDQRLALTLKELPRPKRAKKLPKVLSKEEVQKMIEVTKNLKHRFIIQLLYGCGLRVSELINLRRNDLDIKRGLLLIREGKGKKDRFTLLPKSIEKELTQYLCSSTFSTDHLIEGQKSTYSIKSVQMIVQRAAQHARIEQKVTPHMLRHSFATHLMEQGVSLRHIQRLLGHSRLDTTQIYTKVAKSDLESIQSPLDRKA